MTNASKGEPLCRLAPPSEVADDSPILAGPTDEHLIEACASGTLRIRHVKDLHVEYSEQHPDFMLGAVSSTADRRRWAFAINRKQLDAPRQPRCRIELREWPFSAGTRKVLGDDFGWVDALALAPTGDRIAIFEQGVNRREMTLSILSTVTGEVSCRRKSSDWVGHQGFAWSPNGAWMVVGTKEGHALLDGHSLAAIGHLAGKYSSDAEFSPDGLLLALGYWGHGLALSTAELSTWFAGPPTA